MTFRNNDQRIVALEVRKSCFGYATFQGPRQLLDWGSTTPDPLEGAARRAEKRFRLIMEMISPAVVVIKRPRKPVSRGSILRLLKRMTARRSIPMLVMTQNEVSRAFSNYQCENKSDIADVLTRVFPELIFKLPPKRATGDSERHAMVAFDAIATGFTYMQRYTDCAPPPE